MAEPVGNLYQPYPPYQNGTLLDNYAALQMQVVSASHLCKTTFLDACRRNLSETFEPSEEVAVTFGHLGLQSGSEAAFDVSS